MDIDGAIAIFIDCKSVFRVGLFKPFAQDGYDLGMVAGKVITSSPPVFCIYMLGIFIRCTSFAKVIFKAIGGAVTGVCAVLKCFEELSESIVNDLHNFGIPSFVGVIG